MAAARAMLDEEHQAPVAFTNDRNTYSLGSIQRHNVVIACLPNAQYGTNNAANVLTNLTRTFPSVFLGLMVGVGGGVPNMADVRLGDVVVGTRVMQYDLGKIVEDGQIRRTAVPKIPHQAFGSAVSAIRSEHELRSSLIRPSCGRSWEITQSTVVQPCPIIFSPRRMSTRLLRLIAVDATSRSWHRDTSGSRRTQSYITASLLLEIKS
ncbi:hypothetical protein ColLi_08022 [Colletotrichum liriopes]|uniref:Nucleoside phosphorylase domain-containing protein n=1 Tax=Colletotrichum liriopes TaxID=708192 RepID=A0AA37GQ63_9PEZI|nr:hypothetical protein ColLi_08022 [Colletotrichum liriopes]